MFVFDFFPETAPRAGPVIVPDAVAVLAQDKPLHVTDENGLAILIDLLHKYFQPPFLDSSDTQDSKNVDICICCLLVQHETNAMTYLRSTDSAIFRNSDGRNVKLLNVTRASRREKSPSFEQCSTDEVGLVYPSVDLLTEYINFNGEKSYQLGKLPFKDYRIRRNCETGIFAVEDALCESGDGTCTDESKL